ncbi:fusaric acid resistance protein family protein [Streptomyces acidiscabies]|nr:fusaric acid resistance protein family protein [Streptomyces acidiscabies]
MKTVWGSLSVMAAVLASWGSALWLEGAAHLHVDIVIQAVALTWTLAWTQREADLVERGIGFVVLPGVAMCAAWTDRVMTESAVRGDLLFALFVAFAIWVRRFGVRATRAGTLAALPFVATLVVQGPIALPPQARDGHVLWMGLVAVICAGYVLVVQVGAGWLGLTPRVRVRRSTEPLVPPRAVASRLLPSTRMALQMGVSLGGAFLAGHWLFPDHWTWVVLTAFIVCSGARGRADVLYKGVTRALGAGFGTAVATGVVGAFGPGDPWAVVLLFVVLALATWLRPLNYAYWAACVTAAFSLLYGYFGETTVHVLTQRLQAILVGAVLGIAVSWLLAPVRTVDVVRRRVADALAVLADALRAHDAVELRVHQGRFEEAVELLEQVAPPLRALRGVEGWVRGWPARRRRAVGEGPVGEGPVGEGPVGEEPVGEGAVSKGRVDEEAVGEKAVAGGPVAGGPVAGGPVAGGAASEGLLSGARAGHRPVGEEPTGDRPVGDGRAGGGAVSKGRVDEEAVGEKAVSGGPVYLADAIDAVRACVEPVRELAEAFSRADGTPDVAPDLAPDAAPVPAPDLAPDAASVPAPDAASDLAPVPAPDTASAPDLASLLANIAAVRLAIGRVPGPSYQAQAAGVGSLGAIDKAVGEVARVFPATAPVIASGRTPVRPPPPR